MLTSGLGLARSHLIEKAQRDGGEAIGTEPRHEARVNIAATYLVANDQRQLLGDGDGEYLERRGGSSHLDLRAEEMAELSVL